MTKRAITQSEMVTFSRCEQLHKFRYLELLRPRLQSTNLEMGTAIHLGLEHKDPKAARLHIEGNSKGLILREDIEAAQVTAGLVEIMVRCALEFWALWPDGSEVEFLLPFRNPQTGRQARAHVYAGKIDGLTEDAVWEYKSASRVDASYMDRLDVDFQVSAYLEAASIKLKKPIRKMVYRVLRKPSMKRRKGDAVEDYLKRMEEDYRKRPEFYFFEEIIIRTEAEMDLWRREAWEIHKRILHTENGGFAIRNTESCVGRFGRCAFLDLCCKAVTRDAYRVIDNPHPELGAT